MSIFDALATVPNNLTDKLASAIGWIANHDTPSRIATNTYIQEIQNSNYDPLTKAALISNAKKSIKEYCNQNNIVNIAHKSLKPTAQPENIDSDWLAQFMDKARLVTDSEFQMIWGQILAEECNTPGSIPKVLLHILEQIDKEMAEAFTRIASLSVYVIDNTKVEYSPIILDFNDNEYYSDLGIDYEQLVNLHSIGLIIFNEDESSIFRTYDHKTLPITIHYHDNELTLSDDITEFDYGCVMYTKAGEALCKAITPKKVDGFFEDVCIPFFESQFPEK